MKDKRAVFQKSMAPIAKSLKGSIAASIGRTIVRHSFLEWLQARIIHRLLEISVKQGRLAVKVPRPQAYPDLINHLLQFQGVTIDYPFNRLGNKLDRAERARNALAHSIFIKEGNNLKIQLVTGSWEDFPQDVIPVKRALTPQSVLVDRTYLNKQRRLVEDAIKEIINLQKTVFHVLDTLHKKRRTESAWDRRQ